MLLFTRKKSEGGPFSSSQSGQPPSRPSSSSQRSSTSGLFNYTSIPIAIQLERQGYLLGKCIGEGSYCKVKIAYKQYDDGRTEKIACKIIDKARASSDFVSKFLPRELAIVRGLRHPNIVGVLDVLSTERYVFMFMDLCERGDLLDHILRNGPLPEQTKCRHYFRQIASAIEHLHALDIAHRDLKCENVLLTDKHCVKIADFGFARLCHDEKGRRILSNTFCGSPAYAAPEILQCSAYNPKMYDSWSLGCILFIMLTASMPFDDENIPNMIQAQVNGLIVFPEKIEITKSAQRLILHLLEADITRRATIKQVVKSSWLRNPLNASLKKSKRYISI